jgi:NADH-quinone oxidoreductase subunit G
MARPSWWVLGDLLAAMGETTSYVLAADVFAAMASARGTFSGMSYDTLGLKGQPTAGAAAAR